MYCLYAGKSKLFMEWVTFYLLKSVESIQYFMNLDKFVQFGYVIIQVMTVFAVSNN